MTVDGKPVSINSPRDAIAAGIGLVPEDRKQQALFLDLAVREEPCSIDRARQTACGSASSAPTRSGR